MCGFGWVDLILVLELLLVLYYLHSDTKGET